MKPSALKFRIGVFVLCAATLFVGSLFFFGLTSTFEKKARFVSFFSESVRGLNIGSRVRFKGVIVGQVSDIRLSLGSDTTADGIPVIYEVDLGRLETKLGVTRDVGSEEVYNDAIRDGISAKLDTESLLTGQLYIDLDFRPDSSARREPWTIDGDMRVIPAVPSLLSNVTSEALSIIKDISEVDFSGLSKNLNKLIVRIDQSLEAIDPGKTAANLNGTMVAFQKLANSGEIETTLSSLQDTFQEFTSLAGNIRGGEGPLGKPLATSLSQLAETTDAVRKMTQSLTVAAENIDGPVTELESTLIEFRRAARSLQSLIDFLRRHPNAILFGKEQE